MILHKQQGGAAKLSLVILIVFSASAHAQITRSFTEPIEQREVAAAQADVIARMMVKEGSEVSASEILAELDNNVLKQSLRIAELRASSTSEIESAEAKIKIRQSKYEKLLPMLEKGHANPAELENARAEFESATAELQLAKEKKAEYEIDVERIRAEIERRIIRSPISGVVTEILCRPGEFIASDQRQFATVVRLDKLRVRFYLFEDTVSQLTQGRPVNLLIGKSMSPITGIVEFASPITDPDSATCRVDVVIDNHDRKHRSGTPCIWNGVVSP